MRRLRTGNISQSEGSAGNGDTDNAPHRIPRGILVFGPHKAEQFPLVVGHLIAG